MSWWKTNKQLRKELKKKQQELDNLREDWLKKRKQISDLEKALNVSRSMWDIESKSKRY